MIRITNKKLRELTRDRISNTKYKWMFKYYLDNIDNKYYLIEKYSTSFIIFSFMSLPFAIVVFAILDLFTLKLNYLKSIKNIIKDLQELRYEETQIKALKVYYTNQILNKI